MSDQSIKEITNLLKEREKKIGTMESYNKDQ